VILWRGPNLKQKSGLNMSQMQREDRGRGQENPPGTILNITMAAFNAATQQARVGALKQLFTARCRSRWVAGSSPAMVSF
jgi:hypothetical protein